MAAAVAEKSAPQKKRVRHVWDTGMVPHLWAQQTQDSARNPRGNLFFEGDTLYSYRSSYPIARHVQRKGKGKAVLVQIHTYSATTSGHIRDARQSLSRENGPVFTVTSLRVDQGLPNRHDDNWTSYVQRIEELAAKTKRARANRDYLLAQLTFLVHEANAYSAYFGLRKRIKNADNLDALMSEAHARRAEIRKAELKQEKKRRAQIERDRAESLVRWLRGEGSSYSLSRLPKTYLRVREDIGLIETTQGANFPVEHAVRVWPLLKRLKDAGETYVHNGHTIHLGEFRIDSMDAAGTVTAGCHVVTWDEISRIAGLLGLS